MTREKPGSKPERAVTTNTEKIRTGTDTSARVGQRPVSRQSEAIIKEVSVRRRTAMKVLANR